ncbi:MAG: methyltransferase domain-containing protein [Desulfobacterales bacterium]|nr:methyltransferase domain-containing protein [Desulfobacterales bacterium]
MPFDQSLWLRLSNNQTPIYVRKDTAGWFVPNGAGEHILNGLAAGETIEDGLSARRFLTRLPDTPATAYPGRAALLEKTRLRELWFHMTDRCNLACDHCLFAASPETTREMAASDILAMGGEAADLGCRVFALTGGEPTIHPEFKNIVQGLLAHKGSHVAVLTNGMTLGRVLADVDWDWERVHLQISLDGLAHGHDRIRGGGTFAKLRGQLDGLRERNIPFTLSMCVNRDNIGDMPDLVNFAADHGAGSVHFMWYFVRGRGKSDRFVQPETLFDQLRRAAEVAEARGVVIDNIEAMKTQVFAPAGTVHDGTTAGWESAAIGPDGKLYPSAALVGDQSLATTIETTLARAWQQSPVLEKIRNATIADSVHPLRFLLGGGDLDHAWVHGGTFTGDDPYLPLYEKIALWLIAREAGLGDPDGPPALRLKMGDILESCGAHGSVALVHSNCLLSLSQKSSLASVKDFYRDAVGDTREDILNPVCHEEALMAHVPEEFRFRGYGCGSPVTEASLAPGEHVVDLGCGSGVESFIAARLVGPTGRATGVDMLDPMLDLAKRGAAAVEKNLGYHNLEFKKGQLEKLPLEDGSVDAILSNCVMNLSVHKRRAYGEIFRVLRPGGRLVISDVVCETEPNAAIRNDERLQGECIAGALTEKDLVGILEESGMTGIRFIKRFPYRTVNGHPFFSLTYEAFKPNEDIPVRVMYRGPFSAVVTGNDRWLIPGQIQTLPKSIADRLADSVFVLNDHGEVTNLAMENTCACFTAPEQKTAIDAATQRLSTTAPRQTQGCMVCGGPLAYSTRETEQTCVYCGQRGMANAICENGHHVCDRCHAENALDVITHLCLTSREVDMIALMKAIRHHPKVPLHGPEHHALVPGVILATYRNLGGPVTEETIRTGIGRGSTIAGGHCAFMGVCGAAVGAGIALSLLLEANPVKGPERKKVQTAVQQILADIASLKAARCCQRDVWIALRKTAELSADLLPIRLLADDDLVCRQQAKNAECMGKGCPVLQQRKKTLQVLDRTGSEKS